MSAHGISRRSVDNKFIDALRRGDGKGAEKLLDQGADLNAITDDWGSSLSMALEFADFETLKMLVARGADVNGRTQGSYGLTPYGLACGRGDFEAADFLVAQGADPNLPSIDEWGEAAGVALLQCERQAREHFEEAIPWFRKHGVDFCSEFPRTVYACAVRPTRLAPRIVAYVLQTCATPGVKWSDFDRTLEVARDFAKEDYGGADEIVALLEQHASHLMKDRLAD